jgi:hypothetical protein
MSSKNRAPGWSRPVRTREIATAVIVIRSASVARHVSQRASIRTRIDSISALTKDGAAGGLTAGWLFGGVCFAGVSDFNV